MKNANDIMAEAIMAAEARDRALTIESKRKVGPNANDIMAQAIIAAENAKRTQ